jgi:hypothetical protein
MKILRVIDGHGRIITQLGVCDRYVRSEVGAHIKWVWQKRLHNAFERTVLHAGLH